MAYKRKRGNPRKAQLICHIQFRMPGNLYKRMAIVAKKNFKTKSQFIRDAIEVACE